MEIDGQWVLAELVSYDDYDSSGHLLDIKHNTLVELNERDTWMLNAILRSSTLTEALQLLDSCEHPPTAFKVGEKDVFALLERLAEQKLLEPQIARARSLPLCSPDARREHEEEVSMSIPSVTRKQRVVGAGHIIAVLGELCKGDEGLYHAYQYIWSLKERYPAQHLSASCAMALVHREYPHYRLVTGLVERRVAHVIGQARGNEGLCLIRALSLCAYLLSLAVPASVVIARPKYGSRDGFRLHVWVEMKGLPLNEPPNIRDGYRCMSAFPIYC